MTASVNAPSPPRVAKISQTIAQELANDTYKQSINAINMGFTLAAAMAWNETIKKLIRANVSEKLGSSYQFLYAAIVTLLAAFVFTLTKRYAQPSITRSQITPVIGMY